MVPALHVGLPRHVSPQIVTGLDVDTSLMGRDSRGVPAHAASRHRMTGRALGALADPGSAAKAPV
ncbi:hypothetical protein EF879_02145 [Micromonospora sp. HM5-17]|nr:hypothetical protein EF879_02145 [Micromonospora sp. HM5-17]